MRKLTIAVVLVLATWVLSATQDSASASPAAQIDESRNFDALIVNASYVRGALGAQECRSGAVIDLSDGDLGHVMHLQVGHTYHFQNAWIYEGNPGELFLLWYNSRGFSVKEVAGCTPPPLPQPTVSIRTDAPRYMLGDTVTICYVGSGHVEAIVYLPDGTARSLGSGEDDGSEDCFKSTASAPIGRRRLVLNVSWDGRVVQTAETSYDVLPAPIITSPTYLQPAGSRWVKSWGAVYYTSGNCFIYGGTLDSVCDIYEIHLGWNYIDQNNHEQVGWVKDARGDVVKVPLVDYQVLFPSPVEAGGDPTFPAWITYPSSPPGR